MSSLINKKTSPIYTVILIWNPFKSNIPYKIYCAETLSNLFGYNSGLAVKLIYEAEAKNRVLVYTADNYEDAITARNNLLALGINSAIAKTTRF